MGDVIVILLGVVVFMLFGCLVTAFYMMYRQALGNKDTDLYLLEVDYIGGKVKLKPYIDKGRYEKW